MFVEETLNKLYHIMIQFLQNDAAVAAKQLSEVGSEFLCKYE